MLVTLEELKRRCDFDIVDDMAVAALEDLSTYAIFYGKSTWLPTNVPAPVKALIVQAAKRYLSNPDGYIQSRAGDETVAWPEAGVTSTATFTQAEMDMLDRIANPKRPGLASVQVSPWGARSRTGDVYFRDADNDGLIPFIAEDDPSWLRLKEVV